MSKRTDSQAAFRTYSNYVRAFVLNISDEISALDEQSKLPGFGKIQRDFNGDIKIVERPLQRGWLTLEAMKHLPIQENPALALTSSFWVPVQAYYAIHGFGLAALGALGASPPENHASFIRVVGEQFAGRLLPCPFSVNCTGDTESKAAQFQFSGVDVSSESARSLGVLSQATEGDSHIYIAKCLMTSRERILERKFGEARKRNVRPGKRRSNLTKKTKSEIESKLQPTTVFDFFYRMRVRSNYHDPEMFIFGPEDEKTAQAFVVDLTKLTRILAMLLYEVIKKKIPKDRLGDIEELFKNSIN